MSPSKFPNIRLILAATLAGVVLLPSASAAQAQPSLSVAIVEDDPNQASTFRFDPGELTIKAGTSVTWANKGKQPHNAAANDGAFDSGTMMPGASWQYRFDTPGDYAYTCTFHPQMTGMVQVTP